MLGAGGERTEPMQATGEGWWAADAEPGDGRYSFALDDGDPWPDPRGRRQPDGVHAPSALVDMAAITWTDHDWAGKPLKGSVVYEVHVGTFTPSGTFDGAIERLDYLADLGVDVIELMPVASFPGRSGWGYDGVALYSVHEAYGGPEGLQRFVDAAHAHGLAVWLDVVYNHTRPRRRCLPFPAHISPTATRRRGVSRSTSTARAATRCARSSPTTSGNGSPTITSTGCGSTPSMPCTTTEACLLEKWPPSPTRSARPPKCRRCWWPSPTTTTPASCAARPGRRGWAAGLDGQWADDVHHALHVALTGEAQGYYADFADPQALPKVLGHSPFFHDGTYSSFPAVSGTTCPGQCGGHAGWRFIDVAADPRPGRQPRPPAIASVTCAGSGRAAIGALLLTSPYTPMLFMGEEFDASTPWQYFTDHSEEWLAESIREGRQAEFAEHGWSGEVPDPQDPGTVETSTLEWAELDQPQHAAMLSWYRTLIALRRRLPDVREAVLGEGAVARDGDLLLVRRGELNVVANLGDEPGRLPVALDAEVLAGFGEVRLDDAEVLLGPGSVGLLLAPPPTGVIPVIADA
ncbi:MAG: alpha-amylase family glycosyl hydrolase [Micropruina glycogenica]